MTPPPSSSQQSSRAFLTSEDRPSKPGRAGFVDTLIIILVSAAIAIFLLWAASRATGLEAFEHLPSWLQNSYKAIWSSIAAGTAGVGLAVFKVMTRKELGPRPNYLLLVGITTGCLLVAICLLLQMLKAQAKHEVPPQLVLNNPAKTDGGHFDTQRKNERRSAVGAAPAPRTPAATRTYPDPDSQNPKLALARGSQLYNARRYSEAMPFLVTACDAGISTDACNSVGFMYQKNFGAPTDYVKAREYYLKSCNDDSSLSCNNLGTLYRDGLGVPRDYPRATRLFERGCDAGVPEGCDDAGKMYMDGIGVAQDNARALELYKKACDRDLAAGCGDEGFIYVKGLGVTKDLRFAASLFTRACTMGSRNSCFSMGMMYRGGEGVQLDPIKSKEYFGKACDMGDQESCGLAQ